MRYSSRNPGNLRKSEENSRETKENSGLEKDVFRYLDDIEKIPNVKFKDKRKFKSWLFNYACQCLEFEDINPIEAGDYLEKIVEFKTLCLYASVYETKELFPGTEIRINQDFEEIPKEVERDHKEEAYLITKIEKGQNYSVQ